MTETIETAKELCRAYMRADIPTYTEGPPGVGKSEMWEQIAEEEKYVDLKGTTAHFGFIDVRLAQMDPVDLRGLPTIDKTGKTVWARPDFWPIVERDGERGIILFDELGDCGKAMQSAAYQPILNRRVGPHELPKGWYPAAAGNSQKHRAGAQPMSSALANRFAHIEIAADEKCFRQYGTRANVHHYVLGFLQHRPAMLHSMEGATLKAFPTPRSWFKVSTLLHNEPSLQVRLKLIAGCIGEGAAGEFEAFLRTIDLPELEEIIKDPKKTRIPEPPSHKYALASMLAQNADRSNFEPIMTYIKRKEFGRDFEICCVLDASKRDASLTETKAFVEFAGRNNDLTL